MEHIRKRFGSLEVLKDVSLSMEQGEVVSIIGPSGSGKSTFLRCLCQLETIDGGSISVGGEVMKFVFSSSAAVYGEPAKYPITEDMPLAPTNVYGQTKLMAWAFPKQIWIDLSKIFQAGRRPGSIWPRPSYGVRIICFWMNRRIISIWIC